MIKQKKYTFTSSNVVEINGEYRVNITHNIGNTNYLVSVVNNDGEIVNTSNLFYIGSNRVSIFVPNDSISGIWSVYIYYDTDLDGYGFKRLFEQPIQNNLNGVLDYKFAFCDSNGVIKNITVADLHNIIQNNLDLNLYCLRSNNLSDVASVSTARNNLDVYSKTEVNNLIGDMYPQSGYISSITEYQPASGLTAIPTIDIYGDFCGFDLNLNYTVSDSFVTTSGTGINLGYFDVIPMNGVTLTFRPTYSAMFIYYQGDAQHTSHFGGGQIALIPTASGNNVRFNIYIWKLGITGGNYNVECKSSIRVPIISHS